MVQTSQPHRRNEAKPPGRPMQEQDEDLTDGLREELRAMIARRASLYRELEKH